MRSGLIFKLAAVLLFVALAALLPQKAVPPTEEALAAAPSQSMMAPTVSASKGTSTPRPVVPRAEKATPEAGNGRGPTIYLVKDGDTIGRIAARFQVPVSTLIQVNDLGEEGFIRAGEPLRIPGSDGTLPDLDRSPFHPGTRGTVVERMTLTSKLAAFNSPYHRTIWVTYYGRPNVPVMGILGEYDIDELVPLLREQAMAYDNLLGPEFDVMPAFHLVYGMAVKAPQDDGTHLIFMPDEQVMKYIERAHRERFGIILDIQIGALSPVEALKRGFRFLKYANVHLALDPEFAMSHPNQERPGSPIGFVTAGEINEAQAAMRAYLVGNNIRGRRILIVHQFLESMIQNKENLDRVYLIDLTIAADGFGLPWPKIGKYNRFVTPTTKFAGFKLFYRWDEPLLTEREVLGIDRHGTVSYMNVTPNLIIYQ